MKVVSRNLRVLYSFAMYRCETLSSMVVCSLLVSTAIVSLHTIVFASDHLLLVRDLLVILAVIVHLLLLEVLLFGGLHLLHRSAVLGLLVDGFHVVPGGEHLVSTHRTPACTHGTLLSLPFAFFTSTFVQGSVQLQDR